MKPIVSIILPTYNESENLPIAAERISQSLSDFKHEIIVVDDDSPDHTWQVAENLKRRIPQLKVVRRLSGKGLSSAVLTGMGIAEGDLFVVMDSDLQHDEQILPEMIRSLNDRGNDLCLGTRYTKGGSTGKWSLVRVLVSRFGNTLARWILRQDVSDPMSGYFGIKKDLYSEVKNNINPRGFKILLEFLARGSKDLKVEEIPYTFRTRIHGETKLDNSVLRNFLVALLDIRYGKWISPTFLLYALVGATGIIVNLGGFLVGEFLGFPDLNTGISYAGTISGSVLLGIELSVLSNFLFNNYFTFYERRFQSWNAAKGFLIFHSVSLFSLVLQLGCYQFLTKVVFSNDSHSLSISVKLLCDFLSIGASLISNYFLNSNLTWTKATRK
ncbi:glycosyltransferase family 2 protein [Leptospira fluminis]|uniref:Glycosyltransferase family 2 protein n=1 Tax=Leptospira fluminis TaxID=2484979 RepID=A0A4R9GMU3_9LEPT|nr:glycosyltransferase family 2 protein [Leptospira fluminis]TGK17530.1 glycosyltransferase family 2 protein [Leptospira fluminis]